MNKDERRQIRVAFKMYQVWKDEVAHDIANAYERITAPLSDRPGKCSARAIRGFDSDIARVLSSNKYMWCRVVEDTIKHYHYIEPDYLVLIEERFFNGKYDFEVQQILHISRATIYNWEDNILIKAREYAIMHHLIKP